MGHRAHVFPTPYSVDLILVTGDQVCGSIYSTEISAANQCCKPDFFTLSEALTHLPARYWVKGSVNKWEILTLRRRDGRRINGDWALLCKQSSLLTRCLIYIIYLICTKLLLRQCYLNPFLSDSKAHVFFTVAAFQHLIKVNIFSIQLNWDWI